MEALENRLEYPVVEPESIDDSVLTYVTNALEISKYHWYNSRMGNFKDIGYINAVKKFCGNVKDSGRNSNTDYLAKEILKDSVDIVHNNQKIIDDVKFLKRMHIAYFSLCMLSLGEGFFSYPNVGITSAIYFISVIAVSSVKRRLRIYKSKKYYPNSVERLDKHKKILSSEFDIAMETIYARAEQISSLIPKI